MKSYRIIFHIDMNCFFASCEIANNESLSGKPIVVAHDDPLGNSIILSPSYEARKFGIKTTMKVKDAYKLCKNIIVVNPTGNIYEEYSNYFTQYLLKLTNKIEKASIDEVYMDVTEFNLGEKYIDLAKKIQDDLLRLYKLPCSIGIAPNKFLAKMASDMKKPLGITILRKREIDKLLWPLSIEDMMGIGKKTAPKLKELGINKIGDLIKKENYNILLNALGEVYTKSLIERANGNDDSEVIYDTDYSSSSVSCAHTFSYGIYDIKIIKDTLKVLVNTISYKMQNDNVCAYTIGIQIKFIDFSIKNNSKQISRSRSINNPTNNDFEIINITSSLLDEYYDSNTSIILIGVFANRFTETNQTVNKQISLFDDLSEIEKDEEINKLLKNVNNQYGDTIIKKGFFEYKKNK